MTCVHDLQKNRFCQILMLGGLSVLVGCTFSENSNQRTRFLAPYSHHVQKKVDQTCRNLGITHFIIENQTVHVKNRKTGEVVALKHYRPVMPDGYYYCPERSKHTTDLE